MHVMCDICMLVRERTKLFTWQAMQIVFVRICMHQRYHVHFNLCHQIAHFHFSHFTSFFLPPSFLYCFQKNNLPNACKINDGAIDQRTTEDRDSIGSHKAAFFLPKNNDLHLVGLEHFAMLTNTEAIRRILNGTELGTDRLVGEIVILVKNIEEAMKDENYTMRPPGPEDGPASLVKIRPFHSYIWDSLVMVLWLEISATSSPRSHITFDTGAADVSVSLASYETTKRLIAASWQNYCCTRLVTTLQAA